MKASGRVTAACAGFLGCTDLLSSHFAKPFYVCTGKLLHSSVLVHFALYAEFPCAAKFTARVSKLSVPSDPGKLSYIDDWLRCARPVLGREITCETLLIYLFWVLFRTWWRGCTVSKVRRRNTYARPCAPSPQSDVQKVPYAKGHSRVCSSFRVMIIALHLIYRSLYSLQLHICGALCGLGLSSGRRHLFCKYGSSSHAAFPASQCMIADSFYIPGQGHVYLRLLCVCRVCSADFS